MRLKTPPWVPLGSPLSMSYVDFSDDITKGRVPTSCQGDLPDFFYRLLLVPWLLAWFVFDGVTPGKLHEHMSSGGLNTDGLDSHAPYLALRVLAMGWSWAVFFAHAVPQSVFTRSVQAVEGGGQLIDGLPTPQLDQLSRWFWVYIDDFSCLQFEPKSRKLDVFEAKRVSGECRQAPSRTTTFRRSRHCILPSA